MPLYIVYYIKFAGRVTEHADRLQRLQAGVDTGPGCIIDEWSVMIDEWEFEKTEPKYNIAVFEASD